MCASVSFKNKFFDVETFVEKLNRRERRDLESAQRISVENHHRSRHSLFKGTPSERQYLLTEVQKQPKYPNVLKFAKFDVETKLFIQSLCDVRAAVGNQIYLVG